MSLAREIVCNVGGELITLRPTLKRALRLSGRAGSFAHLITQIEDGSLTAAASVIADDYTGADLPAAIMKTGVQSLTDTLLAYILECAGLNADLDAKATEAKPKSAPTSFEEHLTGLFRIATGWLGWTPKDAWDATPSEIIEAYKGRIDLLKAVFGSSDEEAAEPVDTNERFKTVLQSLGTIKVERTP